VVVQIDQDWLRGGRSCLLDQCPGWRDCANAESRQRCKKLSSGTTARFGLRAACPISAFTANGMVDIWICHPFTPAGLQAAKCNSEMLYTCFYGLVGVSGRVTGQPECMVRRFAASEM